MPTKIHPLMRDTDHILMVRALQIKDDVTPNHVTPIPRADLLTDTTTARVLRYPLDRCLDLADVLLCLKDAPAMLGEVPGR